MAKEAFYFTHDYGSRNDPKMQKVLMKMGHEGKSVYWDLVEMLYEEGGYLKISECENYAFAIRTEATIINRLINDFDLFINDGEKFWSQSILSRMDKRSEKSFKASKSATAKWGKPSDGAKNRSERLTEARLKGTHTKEQWTELLEYFNECVKCGEKENLVKDHIIPIYQGGSDSITNLQPLCRTCNCAKGSENKDYRPLFTKNACEMPATWFSTPAIKESIGKEIKESIDSTVGLVAPTTPVKGILFEERCKKFIENFNTIRKNGTNPSKFQVTEKVRRALKARLLTHDSTKIITALKASVLDKYHIETSFIHLTPEYILREDIVERYLNAKLSPAVTATRPVFIDHSLRK